MSRLILKAALLFASASIFASPASAQAAPAASASAAVDPEAIAAVDRMAAYLRTLKTFDIKVASTIETVLPDGQKVQFGGSTQYEVNRPYGFYANLRTDRVHREFYFDGKKLTMFAPRLKYYTSVDAPGNIRQMLDMAFKRFGIVIPLVDLFYWGESSENTHKPSSAMVIGLALIGEAETDQYAFREDGIDYQIWIQRGDQPLPLRMVYTDAQDPARPQYTATIKWTLNPTIASDRFTFTPPKDVNRIEAVALETDGNSAK